MRAGLFWLNDRQWARIKPRLPTGLKGPERDDDRRIISGIIHMLQSVRDGVIARVNTALTLLSTIASTDGPKQGDGAQSLKRWPSPAKMRSRCRSTRLRSKLTGAPPAEKGGAKSGNRPLARRPHDKNSCAERSSLSAGRLAPDSRAGCGYRCGAGCSGARAAHERAPRRQRVRRRQPSRRNRASRRQAGHPQQIQPCCDPSLQQTRLQRPKCHRALFLQAQGLPADSDPIRQAGSKFHGCCSSCRSCCILAKLSLDPNTIG